MEEYISLLAIDYLTKNPLSNDILSNLHHCANCDKEKLKIKSLQALINYIFFLKNIFLTKHTSVFYRNLNIS